MRDFDEWLSKFRASISSYDYYIDFEKVVKNVEEIKVELNIDRKSTRLNSSHRSQSRMPSSA